MLINGSWAAGRWVALAAVVGLVLGSPAAPASADQHGRAIGTVTAHVYAGPGMTNPVPEVEVFLTDFDSYAEYRCTGADGRATYSDAPANAFLFSAAGLSEDASNPCENADFRTQIGAGSKMYWMAYDGSSLGADDWDGFQVAAGGTRTITFVPLIPIDQTQVCGGRQVTGTVPTAADDVLVGTTGDDVINGGKGADIICGDGGDDTLIGGIGSDFLIGDAGADNLTGKAGDDWLIGGPDDDTLKGGTEMDVLLGGTGSDALIGGKHRDRLLGQGGSDTLIGAHGNDLIWGGAGYDEVYGRSGYDKVWGDTGNDLIFGGDGNDRLEGGPGDDTLRGAAGDDDLDGGTAGETLDDILIGGNLGETTRGDYCGNGGLYIGCEGIARQ